MSEVRPSTGWGVLHFMLRARRVAPGARAVRKAIEAFTAVDPQQVIVFSVLGGRADLGLMALGPDLDASTARRRRGLRDPRERSGRP